MSEYLVELLLAAFGVGFGLGILPGLWWGERGRRRDAQIVNLGREPGQPPPAAKTIRPGRKEGDPAPELAEPPEKFVAKIMEQSGCSRAEAEEEWRRMLSRSLGDHGSSW